MATDVGLEEPLIEFFVGENSKAMQRVLERARMRAETSAGRLSAATVPQEHAGLLVRALNHAMSAYGRSIKNGPSIRQVAPDTGGRPYHFGYSTLSKGTSTRGRQKAAVGAGGSAGAGPGLRSDGKAVSGKAGKGREGANTAEAAHQIYTERDGAVDHNSPALTPSSGAVKQPDVVAAAGLGQEGAGPGPDFSSGHEIGDADRAADAREYVEGVPRDGGVVMAGDEAAAQAYIEDEEKVPKLMGQRYSFGTIGDTIEARLAFWDLVHERESDNGGRTQTRMVVELPHEATPDERHEIVRRFTEELRLKGIPFWAAIHAPTKKNDQRNHHAHIVCTSRPMRMMPHPETGLPTWDFAIAVTRTKAASRNRVTTYPYRQNRDPEMRDRNYVKKSRARLADVVNDVMSESKSGVRYDPRSYRDMGLDVAPMRNVARVLADKLGRRSFVVMDAEWTRKMIHAEMMAAAARRTAAFVELQEAEAELHEAAKASEREVMGRRGKSPFVGKLAKAASDAAFEAVLKVKRDRLAARFVSESTAATLEHIAKATSPAEMLKRAHDPEEAPDAAAITELHEAAQKELAEHRSRSRETTKAYQVKERKLTQAWQQLFHRPLPPTASQPTAASQPSVQAQAAATAQAAAPPDQGQPPVAAHASTSSQQGERGHRARTGYIPPSGGRYAAVRAGMQAMVDALLNLGLSGAEFAEASKAMVADLGTANRKLRADQAARASAAATSMQTATGSSGSAQKSAVYQTSVPTPLPAPPQAAPVQETPAVRPAALPVRQRAETTADVRLQHAPAGQPQQPRPFMDDTAFSRGDARMPPRPATSSHLSVAKPAVPSAPAGTPIGTSTGLAAHAPTSASTVRATRPVQPANPRAASSMETPLESKSHPQAPGAARPTTQAVAGGALPEPTIPARSAPRPDDRRTTASSLPTRADSRRDTVPALKNEAAAPPAIGVPTPPPGSVEPVPPALHFPTEEELDKRRKEQAARRRRQAILAARRRGGPGL